MKQAQHGRVRSAHEAFFPDPGIYRPIHNRVCTDQDPRAGPTSGQLLVSELFTLSLLMPGALAPTRAG